MPILGFGGFTFNGFAADSSVGVLPPCSKSLIPFIADSIRFNSFAAIFCAAALSFAFAVFFSNPAIAQSRIGVNSSSVKLERKR